VNDDGFEELAEAVDDAMMPAARAVARLVEGASDDP
jgi:hypothetical protein